MILFVLSSCVNGSNVILFFFPETKGEASPYGQPVAPEEAPEAITQAVASLPPEQMFELMKQMKVSSLFHNTSSNTSYFRSFVSRFFFYGCFLLQYGTHFVWL